MFGGIVTTLFAVLKKVLTDKANLNLSASIFGLISWAQLLSWVFAVLVAFIANIFGVLGAGGWDLIKILAYGVYAGGVSNALWNVTIIKNTITMTLDKLLGKSIDANVSK